MSRTHTTNITTKAPKLPTTKAKNKDPKTKPTTRTTVERVSTSTNSFYYLDDFETTAPECSEDCCDD